MKETNMLKNNKILILFLNLMFSNNFFAAEQLSESKSEGGVREATGAVISLDVRSEGSFPEIFLSDARDRGKMFFHGTPLSQFESMPYSKREVVMVGNPRSKCLCLKWGSWVFNKKIDKRLTEAKRLILINESKGSFKNFLPYLVFICRNNKQLERLELSFSTGKSKKNSCKMHKPEQGDALTYVPFHFPQTLKYFFLNMDLREGGLEEKYSRLLLQALPSGLLYLRWPVAYSGENQTLCEYLKQAKNVKVIRLTTGILPQKRSTPAEVDRLTSQCFLFSAPFSEAMSETGVVFVKFDFIGIAPRAPIVSDYMKKLASRPPHIKGYQIRHLAPGGVGQSNGWYKRKKIKKE